MKVRVPIALSLLVAACAGAPAPTEQVASALAATRGAEEAGALQHPQAALHLKLAEDQITRARQLMEEEKNERARSVAVRAYQDAELAIAIARENQAARELETFSQKHATAGGESAGGQSSQ